MQEIPTISLPANIVEAILKYMYARPYAEVAEGIAAISAHLPKHNQAPVQPGPAGEDKQ
jgi:hypothetical protein